MKCRFLRNWDVHSAGEIVELNHGRADIMCRHGLIEYVNEPEILPEEEEEEYQPLEIRTKEIRELTKPRGKPGRPRKVQK